MNDSEMHGAIRHAKALLKDKPLTSREERLQELAADFLRVVCEAGAYYTESAKRITDGPGTAPLPPAPHAPENKRGCSFCTRAYVLGVPVRVYVWLDWSGGPPRYKHEVFYQGPDGVPRGEPPGHLKDDPDFRMLLNHRIETTKHQLWGNLHPSPKPKGSKDS